LSFAAQLEGETLERFSETVNLAPMFTAAAAVRAMLRSDRAKQAELDAQIDNVEKVVERSTTTGWHPFLAMPAMHTGILLMEANDRQTRVAPTDRLRERFRTSGIALTTYGGGLVRASLPDRPLSSAGLDTFQSALIRCA